MANVAIAVRRSIIKNIEVSIGSSNEEQREQRKNGGSSKPTSSAPTETFGGTTGVARPFISDTTSSKDIRTKSKDTPSSTEVINPNLFIEKSVNLEMYENIRAPSKILDLRSLLINENEDNIIFEMMENNYEMFEVDQLSGHLVVIHSPDREQRDKYTIKIRAVKTPNVSEREVPVFFYTLYVKENEKDIVAEDMMYININILDLNDNKPEFLTSENPVEISVSSHLETGELIAKMEAWDSDLGANGELRYRLVVADSANEDREIFTINEISGDVTLRAPLVNQAGRTFRMIVEATDSGGLDKESPDASLRNVGLTGTIQLVVYVLDSNYQLTMVLSSGVAEVTRDLLNITRALTSLTGYSIGTHNIEEHISTFVKIESNEDEEINGLNSLQTGSGPMGGIGSEGSTDLYIYAIDAQDGLVKTDEMIR